MIINSSDNKTFKNLLKLTQKKYRFEQGLCIIEGEKLVCENRAKAKQLFIRESHIKNFSSLMNDSASIVCKDKLFDSISDVGTNQGILAVVPIPKIKKITFPYLVLDGIQDPGNMGTILRTAAAFCFNTVFCINCADVWSQKVLRAGAGTQFHLNIFDIKHDEFENIFKKELNDSILLITDVNKTGQHCADVSEPKHKFGLVLGSEGNGVSAQVRIMPHEKINIPINSAVESLNVAVAGGILMYLLTK